jgi:hypothetical protein
MRRGSSRTSRFYQLRREPQVVHELADAVIALASAQGFPQWLAQGIVLRGWALAEQGQAAEGVAQIRQGLAAWRATGAEIGRQWRLLLLAEAHADMGQTAEGLATLAEVAPGSGGCIVMYVDARARWCASGVTRNLVPVFGQKIWRFVAQDRLQALALRSTERGGIAPDSRYDFFGMRCARSLP